MSILKRTEYFVSRRVSIGQHHDAVKEAVEQRDAFLAENKKNIDEIIAETIDYKVYTHGSSSSGFAIITLSYYSK